MRPSICSADLTQTKGLLFWFQASSKRRMALRLMMENQVSTSFIQLEPVGVKCKVKLFACRNTGRPGAEDLGADDHVLGDRMDEEPPH